METTPGAKRSDGAVIERVRSLVEPIASDLSLDLYDVEQRGGTIRITLDTPPGSQGGVDLDTLALATRLVSRELDHEDPVPGRYTLEVTSPGVERALRTPAHFQREIGKVVSVRLADVGAADRRIEGELVGADHESATLRVLDAESGAPAERTVAYAQIDRARTVFEWGPAPKPGSKRGGANQSKRTPANQPGKQQHDTKQHDTKDDAATERVTEHEEESS